MLPPSANKNNLHVAEEKQYTKNNFSIKTLLHYCNLEIIKCF